MKKTLAFSALILLALSTSAFAQSSVEEKLENNDGIMERYDSAAGQVDVRTSAHNGVDLRQGVDRMFLISGNAAQALSKDMTEKGHELTDDVGSDAQFQKSKAEVECTKSAGQPVLCLVVLKK